jgi:MFS family permease
LGIAFMLLATSLAGLFVHMVPMLTDMKRGPSEIASIVSWFGVAVLVGRLIAGWLLDRVFASYLAILFVCGAMIGVAAIYVSGPALTFLGAILVGLAYGTELDIAGYMTARYFGNRAYGAIYGWQYGMFMAGGILSPLLYGIAHDRLGSYQPGLLGSLVLMAPTILLFLTMGPYPDASETDFTQPSIAPDTIAAA